ncbi:MAG: hypothetical protein ACOY9Y_05580 [Bacillota bacterium]
MLKKLLLLFTLCLAICLAIVVGVAYFWLWPMAQQYLASIGAVLQQSYGNIEKSLPVLFPEGEALGLKGLVSLLPILEKIGAEGLVQIKELAAGGFTMDEAQQALEILRNQLSTEEISQLRELFNMQ